MANAREFTKELKPAQRAAYLQKIELEVQNAEGMSSYKIAILQKLIAYSKDKLVSPFFGWTKERIDRIQRCEAFFNYKDAEDLLFAQYILDSLDGTDELKKLLSPLAEKCKTAYMEKYIATQKPEVRDISETLKGLGLVVLGLFILNKSETSIATLAGFITFVCGVIKTTMPPSPLTYEQYVEKAMRELKLTREQQMKEAEWRRISEVASQTTDKLAQASDKLSDKSEILLQSGIKHSVNFYKKVVDAVVIADSKTVSSTTSGYIPPPYNPGYKPRQG